MHEWFANVAQSTAKVMGEPLAFVIALVSVLVWAVSGPLFGWSDTWQLVINTGTTVATFLMVFLLQSTQNRDTRAMHLKMDEIIRVTDARNVLIGAEQTMSDEELRRQAAHERSLAQRNNAGRGH